MYAVCNCVVQGGLITALTVLERPDLFSGVIFSAPAIVNVNVGFFKVSMHILLSDNCFCDGRLSILFLLSLCKILP